MPLKQLCGPRLPAPAARPRCRWPGQVLFAAMAVLALLGVACDRPPPAKAGPAAAGSEHAHVAPHGGRLIELGEHLANIELLLDATSGRLTAFVLDAHASRAIRIAQERITLRLDSTGADSRPAGQPAIIIELLAVANTLTGETPGNTSQFEATVAPLRNVRRFSGRLTKIELMGRSFEDVPIEYD